MIVVKLEEAQEREKLQKQLNEEAQEREKLLKVELEETKRQLEKALDPRRKRRKKTK